jgi:hypothetical protein
MTKLTPLQATAPRKIWLQISDDARHHAEPFPREAEITWCEDSVTACQVGYVRADIAQRLLAALERFQDEAFDYGMPMVHPCRVQAREAIEGFNCKE